LINTQSRQRISCFDCEVLAPLGMTALLNAFSEFLRMLRESRRRRRHPVEEKLCADRV